LQTAEAGAGIQFALKLNAYARPAATPFAEFRELTVAAEELGFDGAYVIDHLSMPVDQLSGFSASLDEERPFFPDAWTLMGALAACTERVRIGPQVTPLFRLHPVNLARAGAAIDWVSGGRFVLQVGAGWNPPEFEQFGLPYPETFQERYERTVEGVRVIRALWETDGPVTFEGDYYRLQEAPLWPKPVSSPPIWIGGSSKRMRRAVAELGDAWTPAAPHYGGLTPDAYHAGMEEIRTLAADEFGRDPDSILPAAFFFVIVGETRDAAAKTAENLLNRPLWRDLSIDELGERGIAMIGDPDEVVAALRRYVDAGVRYFTIAFMPIADAPDTRRAMQLFHDAVMPEFALVGT
jgi:probable F420-dependent oxidoreductase